MSSDSHRRPRIAYLYSRYPVVSQTFCDSEMLALEADGFDLDIASINPPPGPFRHERFEQLKADVFYPPPSSVLAALKKRRQEDGSWQERFGDMIARHDRDYGADFKASTRARNGLYFAELFRKRGIEHFHVHFANRATHTALFIKQWAGVSFSFTAHAQDFMVDLGSDDLLRELCREAEFVAAVSDYSAELLRQTCADSAEKIERVYNGIAMENFPAAPIADGGPLRIISIGRLIEFKGFHHLIGACALLEKEGVDFRLTLIGEGSWREQLEALAAERGVADKVEFAGVQSQEQVKQHLVESDVFCLPCIVDSKGASDILPTVITEAMGCSLPVVSTKLVGVPEMVADGETGLLVEPGDEPALAEALARLANDRKLARNLGKAGRARAEGIFELKITGGQLAGKLRAALESNEKPEVSAPASESLIYLVDTFPASDPLLAEEIAFSIQQGSVIDSTLSVRTDRSVKCPEIPDWPEQIEFFPDALVIEAEWEANSGDVEKILEWRKDLGSAIDSEEYLRQARRALHLARVVRKRGIRHLHAARSNTAVTVWLVRRLAGCTFSFTVEPGSAIGASAFDCIAEEAILVSRADRKCPEDDLLQLCPPDRTRRLKLGPLKIRLPGEKPPPDREPVYRQWFDKLIEMTDHCHPERSEGPPTIGNRAV